MAKVLFFNFDGTDNEPADAMQDKNFLGVTEDSSITNILKFHLLLGGNLREKTGDTRLKNGSRSFYYNGIGTYGNFFERKYNSGLASESADVSTILRLARMDFDEHFVNKGGYDYVVVTGFSRGAALARRFASTINDRVGDGPRSRQWTVADWVSHPKGYFQPGVLALSREGRVLYRWRCRPTRQNVGGASGRPTTRYAFGISPMEGHCPIWPMFPAERSRRSSFRRMHRYSPPRTRPGCYCSTPKPETRS